MIQSTKINENIMETIQEIINKGNLKVATDLTTELQQLIDKESKSGNKPLCSKTRRKSIIGILAEKLKDIECVDISVRFNTDK